MIIGVSMCKGGGEHVFRWIGMDTVQCKHKLCGKRFSGHPRELDTDWCHLCKRSHPNE